MKFLLVGMNIVTMFALMKESMLWVAYFIMMDVIKIISRLNASLGANVCSILR